MSVSSTSAHNGVKLAPMKPEVLVSVIQVDTRNSLPDSSLSSPSIRRLKRMGSSFVKSSGILDDADGLAATSNSIHLGQVTTAPSEHSSVGNSVALTTTSAQATTERWKQRKAGVTSTHNGTVAAAAKSQPPAAPASLATSMRSKVNAAAAPPPPPLPSLSARSGRAHVVSVMPTLSNYGSSTTTTARGAAKRNTSYVDIELETMANPVENIPLFQYDQDEFRYQYDNGAHPSTSNYKEYTEAEMIANPSLRRLRDVWRKVSMAESIVKAALMDAPRHARTDEDRARELFELEKAKVIAFVGRKFNLEHRIGELLGIIEREQAEARRAILRDHLTNQPKERVQQQESTENGEEPSSMAPLIPREVRQTMRQLSSDFFHGSRQDDFNLKALQALSEKLRAELDEVAVHVADHEAEDKTRVMRNQLLNSTYSNYREICWLVESMDLFMSATGAAAVGGQAEDDEENKLQPPNMNTAPAPWKGTHQRGEAGDAAAEADRFFLTSTMLPTVSSDPLGATVVEDGLIKRLSAKKGEALSASELEPSVAHFSLMSHSEALPPHIKGEVAKLNLLGFMFDALDEDVIDAAEAEENEEDEEDEYWLSFGSLDNIEAATGPLYVVNRKGASTTMGSTLRHTLRSTIRSFRRNHHPGLHHTWTTHTSHGKSRGGRTPGLEDHRPHSSYANSRNHKTPSVPVWDRALDVSFCATVDSGQACGEEGGRGHREGSETESTWQRRNVPSNIQKLRIDLLNDLQKLYVEYNYTKFIEKKRAGSAAATHKTEAEYVAEMEARLHQHRVRSISEEKQHEDDNLLDLIGGQAFPVSARPAHLSASPSRPSTVGSGTPSAPRATPPPQRSTTASTATRPASSQYTRTTSSYTESKTVDFSEFDQRVLLRESLNCGLEYTVVGKLSEHDAVKARAGMLKESESNPVKFARFVVQVRNLSDTPCVGTVTLLGSKLDGLQTLELGAGVKSIGLAYKIAVAADEEKEIVTLVPSSKDKDGSKKKTKAGKKGKGGAEKRVVPPAFENGLVFSGETSSAFDLFEPLTPKRDNDANDMPSIVSDDVSKTYPRSSISPVREPTPLLTTTSSSKSLTKPLTGKSVKRSKTARKGKDPAEAATSPKQSPKRTAISSLPSPLPVSSRVERTVSFAQDITSSPHPPHDARPPSTRPTSIVRPLSERLPLLQSEKQLTSPRAPSSSSDTSRQPTSPLLEGYVFPSDARPVEEWGKSDSAHPEAETLEKNCVVLSALQMARGGSSVGVAATGMLPSIDNTVDVEQDEEKRETTASNAESSSHYASSPQLNEALAEVLRVASSSLPGRDASSPGDPSTFSIDELAAHVVNHIATNEAWASAVRSGSTDLGTLSTQDHQSSIYDALVQSREVSAAGSRPTSGAAAPVAVVQENQSSPATASLQQLAERLVETALRPEREDSASTTQQRPGSPQHTLQRRKKAPTHTVLEAGWAASPTIVISSTNSRPLVNAEDVRGYGTVAGIRFDMKEAAALAAAAGVPDAGTGVAGERPKSPQDQNTTNSPIRSAAGSAGNHRGSNREVSLLYSELENVSRVSALSREGRAATPALSGHEAAVVAAAAKKQAKEVQKKKMLEKKEKQKTINRGRGNGAALLSPAQKEEASRIEREALGHKIVFEAPTNLKLDEVMATLNGNHVDDVVYDVKERLDSAVITAPPPLARVITDRSQTTGLVNVFVLDDGETGAVIDRLKGEGGAAKKGATHPKKFVDGPDGARRKHMAALATSIPGSTTTGNGMGNSPGRGAPSRQAILPSGGAGGSAGSPSSSKTQIPTYVSEVKSLMKNIGKFSVGGATGGAHVGNLSAGTARAGATGGGGGGPAPSELQQLEEEARELYMLDPLRYDAVIEHLIVAASQQLLTAESGGDGSGGANNSSDGSNRGGVNKGGVLGSGASGDTHGGTKLVPVKPMDTKNLLVPSGKTASSTADMLAQVSASGGAVQAQSMYSPSLQQHEVNDGSDVISPLGCTALPRRHRDGSPSSFSATERMLYSEGGSDAGTLRGTYSEEKNASRVTSAGKQKAVMVSQMLLEDSTEKMTYNSEASPFSSAIRRRSRLSSLVPLPVQCITLSLDNKSEFAARRGHRGSMVGEDGVWNSAAGRAEDDFGDDEGGARFANALGRKFVGGLSPTADAYALTKVDVDEEARNNGLATSGEAETEIHSILYEQMKIKLLLRAIISQMKALWVKKEREKNEKAKETMRRTFERVMEVSWQVERHRVINLRKLIHLIDRRVQRVHGWIPCYNDKDIFDDSGSSHHFQLPPQRIVRHAMCLAKRRKLLPLRLVRHEAQRSLNQHLLFGYRKHALTVDEARNIGIRVEGAPQVTGTKAQAERIRATRRPLRIVSQDLHLETQPGFMRTAPPHAPFHPNWRSKE